MVSAADENTFRGRSFLRQFWSAYRCFSRLDLFCWYHWRLWSPRKWMRPFWALAYRCWPEEHCVNFPDRLSVKRLMSRGRVRRRAVRGCGTRGMRGRGVRGMRGRGVRCAGRFVLWHRLLLLKL